MGTDSTEGLIAAEWDYTALRALWEQDEPAIRSAMPVVAGGPGLAVVYSRGLTLTDAEHMGHTLPSRVRWQS